MGRIFIGENTLYRIGNFAPRGIWISTASSPGRDNLGPGAAFGGDPALPFVGERADAVTIGNRTDTGMETTWIYQREELKSIYDDWRALVMRTNADLYLGPDWFDIWWDHFGSQYNLACITARHTGILVGVMPFYIETIRIGPLSYRIARIAGTDPHCIVLNLPIEPTWAQQVMVKALSDLLFNGECDFISFTPASEISNLMPLIRDTCSNTSELQLSDSDGGSHIVFDLPKSFDLFLEKLSKKRRAQFRRDVRSLTESKEMNSAVICPDTAGFLDFSRFHNLQWQAVGKGGHFCDWPGSEGFYSALAERTKEQRNVQFHILNGHDGPLAIQFALVAGTTCHWRLPARSLDPEVERFGVGKIGLLMMVEQLIAQGITQVEGGMGEYDYKRTWGGEDVPVRQLIVSLAATKKSLRLLLAWSGFIDFVYYRIWFLKFALRWRRLTGSKPQPLWRTWIRTRL